MLKYEQQIKVNQQEVNINSYVRCFAIIVVQENIFFVTLIHLCTHVDFLCIFLYLSLILFASHQGYVSGKKELACFMPCGREGDRSELI